VKRTRVSPTVSIGALVERAAGTGAGAAVE
jgi:hypothetical protein